MDGMGVLHEPFLACLAPHLPKRQVLSYPPDVPMDYADLERWVRPQLPTTPFVLLGESFSGPLAIRIAAHPPSQLVGLVLSTTFACGPVPLSRLLVSPSRLCPARAPMPLMSWMLLGRWSTRAVRTQLKTALDCVDTTVLRRRAHAALTVDERARLARIRCPVLLLHAQNDRLLSSGAQQDLTTGLPHATLMNIPGPHLLLQCAPETCAAAVWDFVQTLPR